MRLDRHWQSPFCRACQDSACPGASPHRAASLYTCFLLDCVALAQAVPDTDVVVLYVPQPGATRRLREMLPVDCRLLPQQGVGIGEGTANAFGQLLAEGYQQIVLIGSDNPTLPLDRVREAYTALDETDIVLGPAEDGGYYLIGMIRPHQGVFENVSWSTDLVAKQIHANAAGLGLIVHDIPKWYDVDTIAELERVAAEVLADPGHPAQNTRRQIQSWLRSGILSPPFIQSAYPPSA